MVRNCRLFNVFEAFFCKIGDPHVFRRSGTKVAEDKKLCNLLFRNMGKISDTCQDQEYSEFLLPFEMLFKDITNLDTGNFNKECVKNKLHKSTHS